MTGAEMLQRNIDTLGEDCGRFYTALFQELTTLYLYWKEFLELFGSNDKRIARLNQAAPAFFRMLQDQQFETNMLHLARLSDVPASRGKPNLTVCSLPMLVSEPVLKDQLAALVDEVKRKTDFCRDWRNRRFAHRDLLLATQDEKATPLESVNKEKFTEGLQAMSNVLNAVERFYYRGSCDFGIIAAHKGAATLLFVLGYGVKAKEAMEAKVAAHQYDELDLPENI